MLGGSFKRSVTGWKFLVGGMGEAWTGAGPQSALEIAGRVVRDEKHIL